MWDDRDDFERELQAGEEVQPDGLGVAAQRCAAYGMYRFRDEGANGTKMGLRQRGLRILARRVHRRWHIRVPFRPPACVTSPSY